MRNIIQLGLLVNLLLLNSVVADEKFSPRVEGEVIVKFSGKNNQKLKSYIISKYNLKPLNNYSYPFGEYSHYKNESKMNMEYLVSSLTKEGSIEYAEPNFIYRAIQNSNIRNYTSNLDPSFGKLWGLLNTGTNEPAGARGNSSPTGFRGADINAVKAWEITKGSRDIKIAIIDTGIDYNHEDLKNNIWTNKLEANGVVGVDDDGNGLVDDIHGYDFANKDGDPMDGNGHGTHCAGTIGAEHDNGKGIVGVMADVQMVGVKFLTDEGSGTAVDALAAINYATKLNVDIMSNSWGGGGYSKALEDAIRFASDKGIIFTAAAGNSSDDNDKVPHYPSNYELDNIISVAAHNYSDELASFSCYGAKTVHIAAPGRNIYSTIHNNRYDVFSGTSMATPHVSGVIGLYLAHNGRMDVKKVRAEIMKTSVYVNSYDRRLVSAGRINAYNLLLGVYPSRPEIPNPNEWQDLSIGVFESEHPYKENMDREKDFHVPGAKFVRAVVNKLELEKGYDFLNIFDMKGQKLQRLTGKATNIKSEYVSGDTIRLKFNTDNSVQQWGFFIDKIQYIEE